MSQELVQTRKWHQRAVVHLFVCPIRSRWLRRRDHMPFWREDQVARMFGVEQFGCRRCGRDAILQSEEEKK